MTYRPYAASLDCGRRLMAAGCPIDHLNHLPRDINSVRKTLYLAQLDEPSDSRVFDLGHGRLKGYQSPRFQSTPDQRRNRRCSQGCNLRSVAQVVYRAR
jgi:hypothetical protein